MRFTHEAVVVTYAHMYRDYLSRWCRTMPRMDQMHIVVINPSWTVRENVEEAFRILDGYKDAGCARAICDWDVSDIRDGWHRSDLRFFEERADAGIVGHYMNFEDRGFVKRSWIPGTFLSFAPNLCLTDIDLSMSGDAQVGPVDVEICRQVGLGGFTVWESTDYPLTHVKEDASREDEDRDRGNVDYHMHVHREYWSKVATGDKWFDPKNAPEPDPEAFWGPSSFVTP